MTAGGRRVIAYAKSTVVSSTPVRPGKTYPLSVLDHAMGLHSLHMVFYFRPGPTLDRARLKESLSDMLWHFPAATGRLCLDEGKKWLVKCNDAGVRVVDARAAATLEEWIATATAAEERELAYWEPMGDDPSIWSCFYVQITEFSDMGYAVGLSCTHLHVDPTCAVLIIKAWGDCHRRACIVNPPFLYPPALLPRPEPNPSAPFLSLKSSLSSTNPAAVAASGRRMSSATFHFSAAAVRSLLADLRPDFPAATPFDALAALFWLAVARAAGQRDAGAGALTVVTDFRKRMYAPLPHGFYGNAAHFSRVEADFAAGWASVAAAVGRHVAGLVEEDYWSAIEWLAARRESGVFRMYGPELTCVKMDHVLAYQVEMAEGAAPVHMSCWVGGAEGEGMVVVLPAPAAAVVAEGDEAGRAVEVALPAELAEKVFRDEEILRRGPTVLFSGKI
ncbi:Shikimate O-hydroxycinnamoyltransferase [Apostasia shenzhenica]|uniref:Shikimate O-hydroxycinnamoyltransferase n=1 Tax=Apostasia shenzhenica TaxID=1088818 RepID=A0A2I0A1G1_9ASPA|nr:Shikimate O-hydroxycinnamoyltransferase [Apostasia shenzhenica]